jgi:hypothetical protein
LVQASRAEPHRRRVKSYCLAAKRDVRSARHDKRRRAGWHTRLGPVAHGADDRALHDLNPADAGIATMTHSSLAWLMITLSPSMTEKPSAAGDVVAIADEFGRFARS